LLPLIVVGACGAFVTVLRNHAEIVLAHAIVNLRSLRRSRSRIALIGSADFAMCLPRWRAIVHGNGL
jgi:hypothetical protein